MHLLLTTEVKRAMTYHVNEVFYSVQGEGLRAGVPHVFVRFAGCNLRCDLEPGPRSPGGFACDTEFEGSRPVELDALVDLVRDVDHGKPYCGRVILTGGEPGLQADEVLVDQLRDCGYQVSIETNGSVPLRAAFDWITVSPKVAEHAIKVEGHVHELRYVRSYGQALPRPRLTADYYLLSPSFEGQHIDRRSLDWCIRLVKENPEWRLSTQLHKAWNVL